MAHQEKYPGLCVLVGISRKDTLKDAEYMYVANQMYICEVQQNNPITHGAEVVK